VLEARVPRRTVSLWSFTAQKNYKMLNKKCQKCEMHWNNRPAEGHDFALASTHMFVLDEFSPGLGALE
jgi:hypothetical protein